MLNYILYSLSVTIFSWLFGSFANEYLREKTYYNRFANICLIENEHINKLIGLGVFKWIVKKTFFKFLNAQIKITNKVGLKNLIELRNQMTYSEISHLIGFVVVLPIIILWGYNSKELATTLLITNILLNLYPSLLQQQNKRRIDQLIKTYS